jgi:hypothetical protein
LAPVGRRLILFFVATLCVSHGSSAAVPRQDPPTRSDKRTLTPAQQKIDSQIRIEIERKRGGEAARKAPPAPTLVRIDGKGRALVDVRVKVTRGMLDRIKRLGGTVVSSSAEHFSIIARVPLLELERLAGDADVRAIVPAAEAMTNR